MDPPFVSGTDLGAAITNDAYVTVQTVNGNGGITGLTINGTGTDANVDYASPNLHNIVNRTSAKPGVNRTGTVYSATFSNNGSGFIAGETIDIAGTELGGLTQRLVKLLIQYLQEQ